MKVDVYVVTHKKIDYAFPPYCKKIQVNCSANGHFPGYLYDDAAGGGGGSLKRTHLIVN